MSDASGMNDERAALMLELLGTIIQRFDGIEDTMTALSKLQKQTATKAPVERNTGAEIKAIRQAVAQTVADSTVAALQAREPALAKSLSSSVQNALLGNRQDTRLLGEAAENMLHLIRRWAPVVLLGTFLIGLLIGTLIVTWISVVDNARTFKDDIGNSVTAKPTCEWAGGSVDALDGDRFCILQLP